MADRCLGQVWLARKAALIKRVKFAWAYTGVASKGGIRREANVPLSEPEL